MAQSSDILSFTDLIKAYDALQSRVVAAVRALSSKGSCSVNPGQFIMLQFQMANVTQIGESISNIISQVNTVISHSISNQKTQ